MRLLLASAILAASSLSSFAAAPPEGQKLSEIIAKIEQNAEVQYVDETDWSRRGYYKIEYVRKDGAKVKIKIDPKTGSSVR
jgi:uncharacterized membrane protein YkoI